MSLPPDQNQRLRALNTTESFIVQAPAGSGKTALLVERYLRLLCQVNAPEKIVVLTFTKKATHEMKERILAALGMDAYPTELASHASIDANLRQQLKTWQLKHGWDLIRHPHRLRIQTIDAFYAQLVYAESGADIPQMAEDPTMLYQIAIQQLFFEHRTFSRLSGACTRVMRYLNNDSTRIERLLIQMLAHREQWVDTLKQDTHSLKRLRTTLEATLTRICQETYQVMAKELTIISSDWYENLGQLLIETQHLSTHNNQHLFWSALTQLLLTKQDQWRRVLPSQWFSNHPSDQQTLLKHKIQDWLTALKDRPAALNALVAIKHLPEPQYSELQWQFVHDLFHLLNALLVILDSTFEAHQCIDYVGIALKAEAALGVTAPSNFLLTLDTQIDHLLIDEFQDTSLQQIKIFNRLTEGWQPNDGRTIFLVGDPMQSIYRFRKAEARLFQWVKEQGLGSCALQPILLSSNFRASEPLVTWVNKQFQAIQQRIKTRFAINGEFNPSVAMHASNVEGEAVHTHWLENANENEEALMIVQRIQTVIASHTSLKKNSIAVLARAREHLTPIMHQLDQHNIAYQAIDIERLFDQPVVRDLLTLTQSLIDLNDDVAWLSLLRAPWCGLTLVDLQQIKASKDAHAHTLWACIEHIESSALSVDGIQRVIRLRTALEPGIKDYGRRSLRALIIDTWHRLCGPFTQPTHTLNLTTIQRFCECIEHTQVGEMLTDTLTLEKQLKTTYTAESKDSPIVLMTIHKAKGLEFDYVVVPGLHRVTRQSSQAIMLLDEKMFDKGSELLLAPITTSDQSEINTIYRYLYHSETQQNQIEATRVLYVACTRAKKELYLTASVRTDNNQTPLPPPSGSFLHWLWPTLAREHKQLQKVSVSSKERDKRPFYLKRVRIDTTSQ